MNRYVLAMTIAASLLAATSAWAIPVHIHGGGINEPTTWEADGTGETFSRHPNDPPSGIEAGDTRHQHYDAQRLLDSGPRSNADPFTIAGVWNNRINYNFLAGNPRIPRAPYPVVPHGFIDETVPDNIPRYRFKGKNWGKNPQAKKAKPLVIEAFKQWSALEADKSPVSRLPLITGLEFTMVPSDAAAEIDILWRKVPGKGIGFNDRRFNPDSDGIIDSITDVYNVLFDSTVDWFFGEAADTPPDQYHFFSTALHEIGHVVGLWHQVDEDDVMISSRKKGPAGPAFDMIDVDSGRGAYALYSIAILERAPEPPIILLFAAGLIALIATRAPTTWPRLMRRRSIRFSGK